MEFCYILSGTRSDLVGAPPTLAACCPPGSMSTTAVLVTNSSITLSMVAAAGASRPLCPSSAPPICTLAVGDAKSSLGDAESSRWVTLRALAG
jgi:hypothetical protein